MQKIHIKIPEPCHEDWNQMTPDDKGRFCGSCQKIVVDFSQFTDEELIDFFQKQAGQKVCGKLKETQTNRPVISYNRLQEHYVNIRFNYKDSLLKHFYLTVLSLFLIITGCSKPGTTHKVGKVAYTTENTTTTSNNNFSTQNNCNNNLTQTSEITETEITTKGEIEVMGDIYIEPEAVLIHPDSVHTIVDTQPSPVKGMDAYYAEVKKMLKYPKGTDNIQGEVFVSFVVEKDGTVSDIKIAKGLHPLFDEEAIRVIKTHPYLWYSGYIDEEAVRAQMTIPIKFYQ